MSVPSAPTITTITSGNTSLAVSFTAPVSNGGSSIQDYGISFDNGATWSNIGLATSPFPKYLLTNGTTYQVKMRARNPFGNGAESNMVEGMPATVPGMTFITSVVSGDSQITINFNVPASNGGAPITDYKYSLDNGSTWASSGSTSSPIIVTGLTNGSDYLVRLQAVNSVGDGNASIQFMAKPVGLAGAPTIDSIEGGDATLFIHFTAPASDGGSPIGTYLYSVDNGSTWYDSGSWSSPISLYSADDSGTPLVNGDTYQVLIKAVNNVGNSISSNMIEAIPITIVMSSLKANGSDLVLDEFGGYSLTLPEGTTSVTIEAIPVDSNLTVTITGADSLTNNAYNTVTCEITSPSGTVLKAIFVTILVGTYTENNTLETPVE